MEKMRRAGITGAALLMASAFSAFAAGPEFIPQGHVYTPQSQGLPPAQSRQAEIEARADQIQVQNYNRQLRQRRQLESMRLNQFDFGDPTARTNQW